VSSGVEEQGEVPSCSRWPDSQQESIEMHDVEKCLSLITTLRCRLYRDDENSIVGSKTLSNIAQ